MKLLFLGKLADIAGGGSQIVDHSGMLDWPGLMTHIAPELVQSLESDKVRVAVNGTLVADKYALSIGNEDEVAFLPPVSGG